MNAYATARDQGATRCEAFFRAVQHYRAHYPELPVNLAGTEVARILLAAAESGYAAGQAASLASSDDLRYAETN